MNIYQQGNTVRLKCVFRDFDDAIIDPNSVTVKIYDQSYNLIHTATTDMITRVDVGSYFYDYIANITGTLYYEWYGEIRSEPTLKRNILKISFA